MSIFSSRNTETIEINKRRLPLERGLFSQLQVVSRHMTEEIISSYKVSRQATIVSIIKQYENDIVASLKNSYRDVSKVFSTWNRNKFNVLNGQSIFDVQEIKSNTQDSYNISFSDFINQSADTHASYILETINEDVYRAITDSNVIIQNDILNLQHQREQTIGRLSELTIIGITDRRLLSERNILLNRLQKLESTIKELENNKNAKTIDVLATTLRRVNTRRNDMRSYQEASYAQVGSMQIEAQSMVEEDKQVSIGFFAGMAIASIMLKQWDGIRDGKQRPAHALANGQVQKINAPFIVGGELGMMPRADSFSIGNKARCRCHVIYIYKQS